MARDPDNGWDMAGLWQISLCLLILAAIWPQKTVSLWLWAAPSALWIAGSVVRAVTRPRGSRTPAIATATVWASIAAGFYWWRFGSPTSLVLIGVLALGWSARGMVMLFRLSPSTRLAFLLLLPPLVFAFAAFGVALGTGLHWAYSEWSVPRVWTFFFSGSEYDGALGGPPRPDQVSYRYSVGTRSVKRAARFLGFALIIALPLLAAVLLAGVFFLGTASVFDRLAGKVRVSGLPLDSTALVQFEKVRAGVGGGVLVAAALASWVALAMR